MYILEIDKVRTESDDFGMIYGLFNNYEGAEENVTLYKRVNGSLVKMMNNKENPLEIKGLDRN